MFSFQTYYGFVVSMLLLRAYQYYLWFSVTTISSFKHIMVNYSDHIVNYVEQKKCYKDIVNLYNIFFLL